MQSTKFRQTEKKERRVQKTEENQLIDGGIVNCARYQEKNQNITAKKKDQVVFHVVKADTSQNYVETDQSDRKKSKLTR